MGAVYYLGVDGGGTSTTAAVADEKGKVVGKGSAGPSLYKVVGVRTAIDNIITAADAAQRAAGPRRIFFDYSVFGLSGVDSLKDWEMMSCELHRRYGRVIGARFRVVNDVVIAFTAGSTRPYGAAVIAGTGSNAYAVGKDGREAYAGGLGTALADEGSGYWIGSRILHAAAKSFDGRGPKTALEQKILKALGVRHIRDAVNVVYQANFDKTATARLALLAAAAAKQGDRVARAIITEAALELASAAITVARKADLARHTFDLVLAGNLWKAGVMLLRPFRTAVRRAAPRVSFVRLINPPVEGALRLARERNVE